jgi:hypothetical protein
MITSDGTTKNWKKTHWCNPSFFTNKVLQNMKIKENAEMKCFLSLVVTEIRK